MYGYMYPYPTYGYPIYNNNEGFSSGWVWAIIVVVFILFFIFFGNNNCRQKY